MQLPLDAVLKGILLGLVIAISVGPTLVAVLNYSLNHSYKSGLSFVLGVSVSDIMFVVLCNIAGAQLEVFLKDYQHQINYIGGIVLIFIGLYGIFKKRKPRRPSIHPVVVTNGHYFRIWLNGFLMNTLNPSVLITWMAAVTTAANNPVIYKVILFGSCLILVLSLDFGKVFLADRIRRNLTLRKSFYIQRIAAACILVFGLVLIITTVLNKGIKLPF